jgi:cohesin loading factor subunit SCC2
MFKPKEDKEDSTRVVTEPPKTTLVACQQIVDCLVDNVLLLEEGTSSETDQMNHVDGKNNGVRRHRRLAGCMQTLHMFAKIHPALLINHAMTLQPYLTCSANEVSRASSRRFSRFFPMFLSTKNETRELRDQT